MKKKLLLILVIILSIFICVLGICQNRSSNIILVKTEEQVEITLDNWQEYFEEKDVLSAKYNAFDEIEKIYFYKILTLKEGILIDTTKSDVAVEVNGHFENYYVNIDTETWEVKFEERKDNFECDLTPKVEKFILNSYKQGDNEQNYYSVEFCRYGDNMVVTNKETQRSFVERFFIDEVIRIKGTLCITHE